MFFPLPLLSLLILLSSTSTLANTFIDVFLPSPGLHEAYAGSIIGVTSSLTTYAVACVPNIGVCPATPITVRTSILPNHRIYADSLYLI
jgi:hypothetical protein